jgi:hypothetical protein
MEPRRSLRALGSTGIECGHRVTEATDSTLEGIASDGPREILVYETELETARVVLGGFGEIRGQAGDYVPWSPPWATEERSTGNEKSALALQKKRRLTKSALLG